MEQIIHFQDDKIVAAIIEGKPYVAIRPICQNLGIASKFAIKSIKEDDVLREKLIFHTPRLYKNAKNSVSEGCEHTSQIAKLEAKLEAEGCELTPQLLETDENLPSEQGVQPVQVSDFEEKSDLNTVKTQARQMAFLPLEYIHGWLFQIKITNTMKPETKEKLKKYKKEVYKILYEHFFGSKTKITQNVSQRNKLLAEKEALQAEEKFLKGRIKEIDAQLSQIDLDNKSLERQSHRQLELAF